MGWLGTLSLHYTRDGERTLAHDRHDGPLRVLQRLYPEGPRVCHHVLVHPPGGIVGGDTLRLDATLAPDSHALLTTPGATRFYRSAGEPGVQSVVAHAAHGARLEWLPLETIAYPGCVAESALRFELDAGAEMIGWDIVALGLPAAGQRFERGCYRQRLELPGVWLERGTIDAADTRLLDSPLGLAGHRVLATMWFASGAPLQPARREALLDAAQECCRADSALEATSGASSPHDEVVVLRVLCARVEPAMQLLARVWAAWRRTAWDLQACAPRIWRT
jgi:urease accessory protein